MPKITRDQAVEFAAEHFPKAPEKLAEHLGVDVRFSPLSCDGWCIQYETRNIIRINNTVAKPRQRFTLAHELGHLVLGIPSIIGESGLEIRRALNEEEKRVNELAGELLLPTAIVRGLVRTIPITAQAIKRIAKAAKASEIFIARKLALLASEIGLKNATVLFYHNGTFSWQWPDSHEMKLERPTADFFLHECAVRSPSPARFQLPDMTIAVTSLVDNPLLSSQTVLLQFVDEQHGIKKLDEELARDLQEALFPSYVQHQQSLQGCFGFIKPEIMEMDLDEAVEYFNVRYTFDADRWDDEFRNILSSDDGQKYIRLRLKMFQQS